MADKESKAKTLANLYVYDKNGKLIGRDYQLDSGAWAHKWVDKTGNFERGSWRGRCEGEGKENWTYENVDKQSILQIKE